MIRHTTKDRAHSYWRGRGRYCLKDNLTGRRIYCRTLTQVRLWIRAAKAFRLGPTIEDKRGVE